MPLLCVEPVCPKIPPYGKILDFCCHFGLSRLYQSCRTRRENIVFKPRLSPLTSNTAVPCTPQIAENSARADDNNKSSAFRCAYGLRWGNTSRICITICDGCHVELGEKVTSSNLDSLLGPPTQRSLVRFKLSKKSARPDDGGGGAAGRSLAFRRSRSPVRTRSPMGTARRPRRGDTANASPHGRKFVGRPLSSVKETVGNNSGSNLAGLNRNSARSLSAVHSEQVCLLV